LLVEAVKELKDENKELKEKIGLIMKKVSL
jgi:hypothetical protein